MPYTLWHLDILLTHTLNKVPLKNQEMNAKLF